MPELCLVPPCPVLFFLFTLLCVADVNTFEPGHSSRCIYLQLSPRAEAGAEPMFACRGAELLQPHCCTRWVGSSCSPFPGAVTGCGLSLAYLLPGSIYEETGSAFAAEQCRNPLSPLQLSSCSEIVCGLCEGYTV